MKQALITGATDGIGEQTAIDLAGKGFGVIVHGRNPERCNRTAEKIKQLTGSKPDILCADLSSLEEVRKAAEKLKSDYDFLDVLINNAGVFSEKPILSRDGYELTFAVNHLAHFLLTLLILNLLKNTDSARIINVSSMAHSTGTINFDDINLKNNYNGYAAYNQSKLANILFTYELAEKLAGTNITVNCLHPGVISTKLLHAGWGIGGAGKKEGATTSVYLASSPEVENVTGKYFVRSKETNSSSESYNINTRKRLWKLSEEMTGIISEDYL